MNKLERTVQDYNYVQETKRKYRIAILNLSMYLKICNESDLAKDILETYQAEIKSKHYSNQYQKYMLRIVFLVWGFLATGVIEGEKNNRKHKTCI
ncbi:MAG: hypothetical protein PF450_12960, partial [Bacteroidales bacterium]|nr:hypothetical protein [Bacteroidales bacterium]